MSNMNSISLNNATTTTFSHVVDRIGGNTAIDTLDEAQLLLQVLADSLHDDMAKYYQCKVIEGKIEAVFRKIQNPRNPE